MIKINDLPKDPSEAFQEVLTAALSTIRNHPANAALNATQQTHMLTCVRILEASGRRLPNSEDYAEPLERALSDIKSGNSKRVDQTLTSVEQLFYANAMHDHFIAEEEEEEFNTVDWNSDDRGAVLLSLSEARKIATFSNDLEDKHKRRVLYWISKAEAEVLKEKGKFSTILAATDEIGDTIKKLGESAKPFAEIVQMIRTTTRRNVTENLQITADEKPKQLPSPNE